MSTRFVITTRPEEKSGLRNNIECLEIRNVPLTKLVPVPFDREELLRFDPEVFIFTSSYGAGIFARTFGRTFSERMAIAIGDATAAALRESFSKVSVPEKKTSEGIVDKLESEGFYRKRIALLSSEKSNHVVENYLIQKKMRFRSWHLYRPFPVDPSPIISYLQEENCAGIVVTSSYELVLLKEAIGDALHRAPLYVIGEMTLRQAEQIGLNVSEPVGKSNLAELLESIAEKVCA